MAVTAPVRPVLEMRGIRKTYPGVTALDDVDFEVLPGEVHALLGENGAGKSTLMKILAGAEIKDEGRVLVDGREVHITTPQEAMALGISIIYQEFNLVPYMNAAENIFLGREPLTALPGIIDFRRMYAEADRLISGLGVKLDVRVPVNQLSVAHQQMVEIAKATSRNARIIAMDEPSATLTEHELENLFALIRKLKADGVSVIYISHRLDEIFRIADRVTILRDGRLIATKPISETNREEIVRMMVGRELKDTIPKVVVPHGDVVLAVRGLTRTGGSEDRSFSGRRGEILGIAGLVGAGRTEVARAIFGADPIDSGEIILEGKPVTIRSPQEAIRLGIGLATEDRKALGLILGMAVRENVTIANLGPLSRLGFVSRRREREVTNRFVEELMIKTPSIEQAVQYLSGGTQQKVVLAKWLFTKSKVLIFDEPTRGIDVGAKTEIYQLMNKLAEQGVAIIMISSELPEILGMSDRILVMHEGRIAGELSRDEATQEKIMFLATGGQ
ncbi:MAG: sugar ABC transporter ATP-binding protein [Armatimonadota bacterium]